MVLTAMNAANHQTTWGVLGAAVGALLDWVENAGEVGAAAAGTGPGLGSGAAYFDIWDGGREVGVGQVG